MEQGTCGFETWLQDATRQTREPGLDVAFDVVARLAADAFGARLWFVEVFGKRWSYIAGSAPDEPPRSELSQVPLGAGLALVSDGWGRLPAPHRDRLVAFLRQLVARKSIP